MAEAPELVETDEIVEVILEEHPTYPRAKGLPRFASRTGVKTRRFIRPLAEVRKKVPVEVHNDAVVAGLIELGVTASERALANAGVQAHQIRTFITIHATGHMHPSLADHVGERIGLPADVVTIPMTELACAGGAHALALASKLARPTEPVLVMGAEVLSAAFQLEADIDVEHMGFKILFGDGGAATVVTAERPAGPSFAITDSWQYRHPNSLDFYRSRHDQYGIHFDSTKAALDAVGHVVPKIPWLRDNDAWDPQFGIIHPGSKLILEKVVEHRGCSEDAMRYSTAALKHGGNWGAPTLFHVFHHAFDNPPPAGADGVAMSFGPGFRIEASLLRYLP
ncbi:hypothetical protein [Streptomyces chattanoogensis]|uniref:hypothetical protein n=1 Tax=Streptomyces chattanoogensis TaxID=66876 RepID=UPI0036922DAC